MLKDANQILGNSKFKNTEARENAKTDSTFECNRERFESPI